MSNQSASGILATTIEKVRQLVDVSTIFGEPIKLSEEITVIPVSKVTYGFASGGSDFPSKSNQELFGGGGGAGVTLTPVAFLVINSGNVTVKYLSEGPETSVERVVGALPELVDKLTVIVDKFKSGKPEESVLEDIAD